MVKRKNNSVETKAEPARKALTKNEIILQFNALDEMFRIVEEENNQLLEQHEKDLEAISLLEETVKLLEKREGKI